MQEINLPLVDTFCLSWSESWASSNKIDAMKVLEKISL